VPKSFATWYLAESAYEMSYLNPIVCLSDNLMFFFFFRISGWATSFYSAITSQGYTAFGGAFAIRTESSNWKVSEQSWRIIGV
jgi:hypothetical protein